MSFKNNEEFALLNGSVGSRIKPRERIMARVSSLKGIWHFI